MSWAIWITGRPGSGKSVIARRAADALAREGVAPRVLEMDEVRRVLTPTPTYAVTERDVAYRALGFIAACLVERGLPVIVDATAHRQRWRDLARARIARFAEVQLRCSLDTARAREAARTSGHAPHGIYAGAGQPGATVPGVDVPYEEAAAPELVVDTEVETVEAAADRVAALAHGLAEGTLATAPGPEAWVMWITGRPGSGKSTLARATAEALTAAGVPVRLLDYGEVAQALADGAPFAPVVQEIAHRTLAYTATLLAAGGVPVIVDATAPRRAWRDLARQLAPRFAEVQLVCPPEVCGEREVEARWLPAGGPAPGPRPAGPDLVVDYEESRCPDLVIYTHVQGPAIAVEHILRLARRLPGRTPAHAAERSP